MNSTYNNYFFNEFYAENGGGNYTDRSKWIPFFSHVADEIIKKFAPKTVLDAGCAMGYLVEALRGRNVEAYGIDVSEYAISNVCEDIKGYCAVSSITEKLPENFPQKYDLVVTIEVLEHLFPEDGAIAIKNLCSYSDTIIFTSTPDDIDDKTHYNVQRSEYWCREFARHSYFRDLVQPMDFICNWAMLFKKQSIIENVIFDYEINMRIERARNEKALQNNKEIEALNIDKQELSRKIEVLDAEKKELLTKTSLCSSQKDKLIEKIELLKDELNAVNTSYQVINNAYHSVVNSRFWRFTKPIRKFNYYLKRVIMAFPVTRYLAKIFLSVKRNGLKNTLKKIKAKLFKKTDKLTKRELDLQRKTKFDKNIKFSIVVPLYNTPEKFLKEMISSVINQTYSNWELCMADGSTSDYNYIEKYCTQLAKKDKRIKYKKLEKNLGISENTNACIEMSTGDYIALFDHDDLLHPSALFENMKVIDEKNVDLLYSDEDKVDQKSERFYEPAYKPDFSIDYFRSMNYICHFVIVEKSIAEKTGYLNSDYDGAQDFDFVLKCIDFAKSIHHIPKILYHWRAHQNSTALNFASKQYAIEAGRRAVEAHYKRNKIKATVESSSIPGTYKTNYEIIDNPLVSIIIPNKDHIIDLSRCIDSIFKETTYNNYEVIIIENNSIENETFEYYEKLKNNKRIIIETYKGKFNYSKINNFGSQFANGQHLLFLNNDTQIISTNWIQELLMYSQRDEVGIVGAKLYFPDDTIQHAGVVVGLDYPACHTFYKSFDKKSPGTGVRLKTTQNYSAVTGACMMIRKELFFQIGGFSEELAVAFNDIDLCMKVRDINKLVVWTPFCELYHFELTSRGCNDTPEKVMLEEKERSIFINKWSKMWKDGDPYYNPNFNRSNGNFDIL